MFVFDFIVRAGAGVYDIHCHIFPDVDDGSGNMSDSLDMAELAFKTGTKGVIATPHSNFPGMFENYWSWQLDDTLREMNKKIAGRGIPITVYPGQEIYLSGDIVPLLKSGKLITLNFSRYILVEFDFQERVQEAYKKLRSLTAEGYVPIVAHPERYGFVAEAPDAINNIRALGGLIQLNSGSIKGSFGIYPMRISAAVLRNQLADFVASDAHSQYSRTPNLSETHEIVCENFAYDYAEMLFNKNPLKVIKNEEIR